LFDHFDGPTRALDRGMSPSLQLVPLEADRSSSGEVAPSPRTLEVVDDSPPASHLALRALCRAAQEADEHDARDCRLDDVWHHHLRGRLHASSERAGSKRILLISRAGRGDSGLEIGSQDAAVLTRILSGEAQKAVASDLGLSPSTVSGRYVRALGKLDLTPDTIPLALILAAQAAACGSSIAPARAAFFQAERQLYFVVSIARPELTHVVELTCAEQEVARWIVEGCSRVEIANRRKTSVYTVNRQFSRVFSALRITGRFALIRHASELGCFR
jgi:DNA-binding NarL/FixJ family response regulator